MHTIRETALDLFDERGFDAVTIEEIAEASDVSPSSIYRYFGTKEGLIVADEFTEMSEAAIGDVFDMDDPVASLRQAVVDYESLPQQTEAAANARSERGPRRRVRYFFQIPSVRLAIYATLDEASHRIAPILKTKRGMTDAQARVAANALAFGYIAALEQWYIDGAKKPIVSYIDDGMEQLRSIWARPADTKKA